VRSNTYETRISIIELLDFIRVICGTCSVRRSDEVMKNLLYNVLLLLDYSLYINPVYIYLIHINWWRKFMFILKLVVDTKSAPKLEGKRNRRRRSRQIAILVT
jgi:hypothetical protein